MNTTVETVEQFIDRVERLVGNARMRFRDEVDLHERLEELFKAEGIWTEREYKLDGASRIDFYFPDYRVGLEVKTQGTPVAVLSQLHRYCRREQIAAIVLVTTKLQLRMPMEISQKAVRTIGLWRNVF